MSLPTGMYALLSRWAAKEGGTPTSLATELVTTQIRREIEAGRLSFEASDSDELDEELEQLTEYVKLLLGQRSREGLSFAELSDITGISARQLENLYFLLEECKKFKKQLRK